jgi:hypothetical protein
MLQMSPWDVLGLAKESLAVFMFTIVSLAALYRLLSHAIQLARDSAKMAQLQVVVWTLIIVRVVLVTFFPALPVLPLGWTSPPSSFARLQDGLFWSDELEQSPFAANTFQGSPLLLAFYQPLIRYIPAAVPLIGVAADVGCAFLLETLARDFIQQQQQQHHQSSHVPQYLSIIYLVNPITLVSRCSLSLTVWSHLAVLVALWAACRGRTATATLAVALSIHLDVYNVAQVIPVTLYLTRTVSSVTKSGLPPTLTAIVRVVVLTTAWCLFLYLFAVAWTGDTSCWWQQLRFVWSVSDLAPCTSLAWYFFTQLFDRFQSFFLVLFQLHLVCYLPPLATAFWYGRYQTDIQSSVDFDALSLSLSLSHTHTFSHTLSLGLIGAGRFLFFYPRC